MVGKQRLNKRQRRGQRVKMLSRRAGRDNTPFILSGGSAGAGRLGVEDGNIQALSLETLHLEALNQERSEASSRGRRSDRQSRKTPPSRNTKSASQTPAAG